MKKKYILTTGITTAALATTAAGFLLSNKIMYIKLKDPEEIIKREKEALRFDEKWFENCPKTDINILSPNGYTIKGYYLQPLQTKNTMIIAHGVTENKMNSIKYARLFERLGFNAVVYDHRRHGDSGGKTTSYGHYEKHDLQALVKKMRVLIGDDALLGIHGESMGAATMLLYAGSVEDAADFYVSDCAFSDFRILLEKILKESRTFPSQPTISFTDIFMRLRDGYSFRQVSPREAVAHIQHPVLFIHSKPDAYIPFEMAEQLYERKQGPKAIHLFDQGAHAQSFNETPELYEQVVRQFLQQHVVNYENGKSMQ